jgi:hypothetical protein
VQWPGGCTSRRCLYGSTHQPNRGVKWNFGRGGAGGAAPVGSAGGGAGASRTVATAAAVGAAASRRSNDAILLSRSALSSQPAHSIAGHVRTRDCAMQLLQNTAVFMQSAVRMT